VGARFKCDKCGNYDLCSTCLENQVTNKKHTTEHPMILMGLQNLAKIDVHDIHRGDLLGQGGFGKKGSILSTSSIPFFSIKAKCTKQYGCRKIVK